MKIFGPVDRGVGPAEAVDYTFNPPFFPVDDRKFRHKLTPKPLESFAVQVIVIHPLGGFGIFDFDTFNQIKNSKNRIFSISGKPCHMDECMIVAMQATNHGSGPICISYRFHEMPTGKVFVFMTDHEDTAAISGDYRKHLANADLAILDGQYDDVTYNQKTADYGHGTPFGTMKLATAAGVKRVGLTHHDPKSTDVFLEDVILQRIFQIY